MVDKNDYNDPRVFERSMLEHLAKYEKAVKAKDGGQACYHLGAMQSMERRLREFGYTEDQIGKVRNDDKNRRKELDC